jgi:FNIP Repeat
MDNYLFDDITFNILKYLNKKNSFTLLDSSKYLSINKKFLYDKYMFNHEKIKNNTIKKHIRHIKNVDLKSLNEYENLHRLCIICNFDVGQLNIKYNKLIIITNEYKNLLDFYGNSLNIDSLDGHIKCLLDDCSKLNKQTTDYIKQELQLSKFNNLKSLTISGNGFNQPLSNLPNSLCTLRIESHIFNQSLDNLPDNLNSLVLNGCFKFNQPLNNLPYNLNHLLLDNCTAFNQPLDNLPKTLKTLRIIRNGMFDQPLNSLPNTLIELEINCFSFNQLLDDLPGTLINLKISGSFNQPLNNLPHNLKSLTINNERFHQSLDNLPNTLTPLNINHYNKISL